MWAMVLCGLAFGGRVVVYDGSPLRPDRLVLLRLVEKLRLVHMPPNPALPLIYCPESLFSEFPLATCQISKQPTSVPVRAKQDEALTF